MSDPQYPPPPPPEQQYWQGQPGSSQYGQPPGAFPESGQSQYGGAQPGPYSGPRRGTVTAGCIMTWIGAVIGVGLGVFLAALASDADVQRRLGLAAEDAGLLQALSIGFVLWSVLAAVLAFFAFRGAFWAAIALLVMAVLYLIFQLLSLTQGQGGNILGPVYSLIAAGLIFGGHRRWRLGEP